MLYQDFNERDRYLIDEFVEKCNEFYDYYEPIEIDDLEDDEIFFCTQEVMLAATEPYLDSPGSYGSMAHELREYFDSPDDCWEAFELSWGTIAHIPDGRYIIMSNSWSDSGLFRFYDN